MPPVALHQRQEILLLSWIEASLKQELKSDIEAISLQDKQLTDDNARLKEEVISLPSDREADSEP